MFNILAELPAATELSPEDVENWLSDDIFPVVAVRNREGGGWQTFPHRLSTSDFGLPGDPGGNYAC